MPSVTSNWGGICLTLRMDLFEVRISFPSSSETHRHDVADYTVELDVAYDSSAIDETEKWRFYEIT
ncbi:unnamed protein product [Fusarium graminearum]|uniref:Chromosome 1, complete genome n=1 Tax=Gibberella zeae (strain ATCC MYA-4620 / CBS 123657 / FGSC 9075 / NRRL 31084 / PH-1) TaxID=229533 RepID=A0A098DBI3_GIBZE|nr:unnamed protein product [Fusarium graminearum]